MRLLHLLFGFLMAIGFSACRPAGQQVNVYSGRHYASDEALFDRFTKETGIKVNLIKADSDQLLGRLEIEGERGPADLFITPDVSRLSRAADLGLLSKLPEESWLTIVPPSYRDEKGYWIGLTMRARVIVYDPQRMDAALPETYEALAEPQFKGRLVMRSIQSIYNQSLLASILAHHGEQKAAAWVRGLVANMARAPQGNDRDQMKAIASGVGDLGVVNTYYLGQMLHSTNEEERRVASSLRLIFPNQQDRGTHVNVSGAGLLRQAPNRDNALRLLKFLLSPESQTFLSMNNYEFPVIPDAAMPELLVSWGAFRADTISLNSLSSQLDKALVVARSAGWK